MRFLILSIAVLFFSGCKSRSDVKRDQEMERLKAELNSVKGEKADISYVTDELKQDLLRLTNMVEENTQLAQRRHEETMKRDEERSKEAAALTGRIEMLENKELESPSVKAESEKKIAKFEVGKKLFDNGKFIEALEIFKLIAHNRSRADDAKRAQFMVAECYFEIKDYASAALEYSEFKKSYPKDNQVPSAIYRQANAFRLMGRAKEARLFYQELFDKFPKHILSTKARDEMRRLK